MFSRCILVCLITYVVYAAGDCEQGEEIYSEGDTFPALDGCNTCICIDGGAACTRMRCYENAGKCDYGGKVYDNGDEFKSIDECNTCTCISGVVACTRKRCVDGIDCEFNGKVIKSGETFDKDCNTCFCGFDGFAMCTLEMCPGVRSATTTMCTVDGEDHQAGTIFEGEDCNTCLCTDEGDVSCQKRECNGAPRHGMTILSFLVVLVAILCVM